MNAEFPPLEWIELRIRFPASLDAGTVPLVQKPTKIAIRRREKRLDREIEDVQEKQSRNDSCHIHTMRRIITSLNAMIKTMVMYRSEDESPTAIKIGIPSKRNSVANRDASDTYFDS